MSSKITIQRRCECCGKNFTARTTTTRFCGKQCNSIFYKSKIKNKKIEASNQESNERKLTFKQPILTKEILTVKDVAEILESSKIAVYKMISSGRLKAINLSKRKIRILRANLLLLLGQEDLVIVPKTTVKNKIDYKESNI